MPTCTVYATVRKAKGLRGSIVRAAEFVLRREGYARGEVSVHLVGESRMRTLNRVHRGKNAPTDVLSFSAYTSGGSDVGDIFLCVPYIKRQARRFGVPEDEEMRRMLIHGILHALGYTHDAPENAKKMFERQEALLLELS